MDREELAQRLVEADEARRKLRHATAEWYALGERIFNDRRQHAHRSERPDEPGAGSR
jgi:hypothetical protein